ncbi:hypothetical protein BGX21_002194 [Mortierella sp. AD011]|nr:hypothetical protein BGX20_002005 [Mortierella sp. AD010]KAF9381066.1 hypothetical protein BGX21_002194 [Mortierella sp. AD011]
MEKALGLPEIIACIGKYLTRSDILCCIRVQKSWKSELEPLLWRTFTCLPSIDDYGAPSTERRPNLILMQKNAENIRRLYIEEMDPAYHMQFFCQCSQLEEITFSADKTALRSVQAELRLWGRLADMIQNHSRLRKIVIKSNPFKTLAPSSTLLNTLLKCPKLIVFETTECTFNLESTEAYLRANSSNIRRLSTRRDKFSKEFDFSSSDLVFREMRYLDLREVADMSIETQIQWITRCPNLISLYWETAQIIPTTKFCQLVPTSCPNLTALHLLLPLHDQEIEQILKAIPRIEKLSLTRTHFGRLAFEALRRHFPTLKDINLQLAPGASSPMIQEIMSSCPNLQSISGETLCYRDIVKGPWVCQNLQMFDVGIRVLELEDIKDEEEEGKEGWTVGMHRAVYARLSQLSKLEYLSICNSDYPDEGLLMLSLDAGLGQLETLKQLTFFSCKLLFCQPRVRQEAVRIVEWMVQHWKYLESLEGGLALWPEDDGVYEKTMNILKKHGVQFLDYQDMLDDMDGDYIDEDEEEDFDDEFTDEYEGEYLDDEYDDPDDELLADMLNNIDM